MAQRRPERLRRLVYLDALVPEPGESVFDLVPAQAAARMRLSYRRAWGKIKEIEQNLGMALVTSEAGGVGGGHTRLTPEGERLVALYQEFQARMHQALAREFAAVFGALDHQHLSANGGKRGEP